MVFLEKNATSFMPLPPLLNTLGYNIMDIKFSFNSICRSELTVLCYALIPCHKANYVISIILCSQFTTSLCRSDQ